MDGLIKSILTRPYVFAFLAAYVFLAWRLWGPKKMLLWLISGYAIAFASEYSSINNGFPYGWYHYRYENLSGELMIAGVPFFDSLSYPFLIFAGYTTAVYISLGRMSALMEVIFGGALTMALDIIIDPLTKLGDRWFLGLIYYYDKPGWYFGVPVSNFVGWLLVSLAVIAFNVAVWRLGAICGCTGCQRTREPDALYPLFYLSIAIFNIAISFYIGAFGLGMVSSAITAVIIALVARRRSQ